MKIKKFTVTCFFIIALFTVNASMAQRISPENSNVQMYVDDSYIMQYHIDPEGFILVSRSVISNNPDIVSVTELQFHNSNSIFSWILRLVGIRIGTAVITTSIIFTNQYGNDIIVTTNTFVTTMWYTEFRQAPSASTNIVIGDAIKEEDQP